MQQKAEQIQKDLLSAAPQRLQDEGLVPDANGLFAVQCPICRYSYLDSTIFSELAILIQLLRTICAVNVTEVLLCMQVSGFCSGCLPSS